MLIILLGPILSTSIVLMPIKFWDPNVQMSLLETTLYAGLHRGAYAFSICSVIVLLTVGDGLGKIVNSITFVVKSQTNGK